MFTLYLRHITTVFYGGLTPFYGEFTINFRPIYIRYKDFTCWIYVDLAVLYDRLSLLNGTFTATLRKIYGDITAGYGGFTLSRELYFFFSGENRREQFTVDP